jgi:PAS domain S-box-containing protein
MEESDYKARKDEDCITVEGICTMDDEELRLKCRMLAAVFASMGDAVYYTDPFRRILDCNRVAEQVTGYSAEEMRGKYCAGILNHTDKDGNTLCESRCPLSAAAEENRKITAEDVWMRRKDGQRILVEVSCSRVVDEKGELLGMVEVFRDKTRQWELNRMKEDFVAAITHDLKSPIASIMGFAELIANPKLGEISPDKLKYVAMIRQSGKMLVALIGNIVDSSRIEAGQMQYTCESFMLETFYRELRETFMPLAMEKDISLAFTCPEDTWIYGDRGKLLQVFHNLVSNALRYTPQKGTIAIGASRENGQVSFEVRDTGKGIPPEEQGKLFKKFTQVKGERRGTGLGLFIVKSILQGHGSEIRMESEPGKGTHFFFHLKEGTRVEEKSRRAGTLLLVGEESDQIRLVKLILSREGHTVEVAPGGLSGMEKISHIRPEVIVVQHPLPDLRVEDFLYNIRTNPSTKETPVALLSAIRLPEWEKMFTLVLPLPINMSVLRDSVQKLLNQQGEKHRGHMC